MNKSISYAAIIAAMSLAAPAFAQSAAETAPAEAAVSSPAPDAAAQADTAAEAAAPSGSVDATAGADAAPSAQAPTGAAVNTSATVSAGMNVKDSTGATIGQVTDVKADASGQQTATISMGADTFAVGTSSLAVQGGDAVVNATQAEIQQMLKK
jgi:hypothetical protein